MSARVFVSCGQASPIERRIALEISTWLSKNGYAPYVAVDAQTILDLNSGIISALKESDYYLFINFKRERLIRNGSVFSKLRQMFSKKTENLRFRGSLYTHQELAIAYAFGFQNFILINESGCLVEGVLKFIVSNVSDFKDPNDVLNKTIAAVAKAGWKPTHSRQLSAKTVQFVGPGNYRDHTMTSHQPRYFLHGEIANGRPDIAARHTICRLTEILDSAGKNVVVHDHSPIKAVSLSSYEQTIWPEDSGRFDLLSINVHNGTECFLHSGKDLHPRQPIITTVGKYTLKYAVLAEGFRPTTFSVKLDITGNYTTASAALV